MLLSIALAASAVSPPLAETDGRRLKPGQSCFVMERDGKVFGETFQSIRAGRFEGRPIWDIVVHQRAPAMKFDMRDHFILARDSLAPIRFDSARGTNPADRGWHRVSLRYAPNRILGTRSTATRTAPIDVALDHRVAEGNLWGVTFASLDLKPGAEFRVPNWQYDNGFGEFIVRVVGSTPQATPTGPVEAWAIDAGTDRDQMTRYFIAKQDRRELGYRAGPMVQRLGGKCSDLN